MHNNSITFSKKIRQRKMKKKTRQPKKKKKTDKGDSRTYNIFIEEQWTIGYRIC